MATIRKRNLHWQVQVRRKGSPLITKSFVLKKDAQTWATTIESELDQGHYIDRGLVEVTLLDEVLDRFTTDVLPSLKSARSEQSRIRLLSRHLGRYSLAQIRSKEIASYRDARLTEVGPQSVKHELGLLNRVLKLAHDEWGYTLPSGVPSVKMPRLPQGRTRRLCPNEENALFNALRESPIVQCAVRIATLTGMRRSEIMNIEEAHLNQGRKLLDIPITKTGVPRTIPLCEEALEAIENFIILKQASPDFRADSVTQSFSRACKRAGVTNLHFHDLRHEATSRLFEKGLNIMEVALITGHKSLSMLHRYTHLKPESLVDKL